MEAINLYRKYTMQKKTSILTFGAVAGLTAMSSVAIGTTANANSIDVVDQVNVTVPVSCTLSGTGMNTHNATINNGQLNSAIGETTMKAYCNDNNGFAIYAIGYTDDEDGKNVLTSSTLGSTYDIATGTATSGNTSNWAMRLTAITSPTPTYPIIVAGSTDDTDKEQGDPDYSAFQAVPDDYTLVAKRTSGTDIGTSAESASFKTTYQAYISKTQPAGTYTGQVKYTMVHPHTTPAPFVPKPVSCNSGKICYSPNAPATTTPDSMGDQSITASSTSAELWASNFQRSGYGFAGWTDKYDWVLNENDSNGNGTGTNQGYHIYGPNETITDATTMSNIESNGLSLYAVWVPSAGNLQNYTCPENTTMPVGAVTALTDQRDGQVYTVAKLKDNKCWMIENLRLDNQYTTSAENIAKAQGYHSSFIGLANPETANFNNSATTANSLYSTDGSTTAPAITGFGQSVRFPRYNNKNTANSTTNMTAWNNNSNIYSLGNYYTWAAAIADTTPHVTEGEDHNTTSICPTGWHIPTGYTNGEYKILNIEQNSDSTSSSAGLRAYPANFIYSGCFRDSSANNRSTIAFYWSSTVDYSARSYTLYFGRSFVYPGTNGSYSTGKGQGSSIRCSL